LWQDTLLFLVAAHCAEDGAAAAERQDDDTPLVDLQVGPKGLGYPNPHPPFSSVRSHPYPPIWHNPLHPTYTMLPILDLPVPGAFFICPWLEKHEKLTPV
jgi:hypothetical protein